MNYSVSSSLIYTQKTTACNKHQIPEDAMWIFKLAIRFSQVIALSPINNLQKRSPKACLSLLWVYQIKEKTGQVAYKLKLPSKSRIHPVFHASLLKKQIDDLVLTTKELSTTTEKGKIILQPEAILDTQIQICWRESSQMETPTYRGRNMGKLKELQDWFLNLNCEDNVHFQVGSDDKPWRSQRIPIKNPKYLQ